MKTQMNNKSGFTLIEIIVVLIIVGILAAIALPNLFSNVTKSRAAEGLSLLATLKTQMEACQQGRNTTCNADCGAFGAAGGIADPSSANFTIKIGLKPTNNAAQNVQTFSVWAQSTFDGGLDVITMYRQSSGSIGCTGGGANFVGVC